MNEDMKILTGVSIKLLFNPKTIETIKGVVGSGVDPTSGIAKVLAIVFQQAIAKAQQAGARIDNNIASKAMLNLVKEAVEMIESQGKMDPKQKQMLAKGLFAAMAAEMKNLTQLPKGGQQQPMQQQPAMQPGMPAGGM